jgi:hypothetical protein
VMPTTLLVRQSEMFCGNWKTFETAVAGGMMTLIHPIVQPAACPCPKSLNDTVKEAVLQAASITLRGRRSRFDEPVS